MHVARQTSLGWPRGPGRADHPAQQDYMLAVLSCRQLTDCLRSSATRRQRVEQAPGDAVDPDAHTASRRAIRELMSACTCCLI